MIDPSRKYREALAAFAAPGGRWANKGALTYWGKAAGLSADEVIADARAAGVADRDADIRRGWTDAPVVGDLGHCRTARPPNRRTEPRQPTDRVRRLIDHGSDVATPEALRELSPAEIYPGTSPTARRMQTEAHLQMLFAPGDFVNVRRDKADRTPTAPGANLRTMHDWLLGTTGDVGELVRPNPLTGLQGATRDGRQSFAALECVADHRHLIVEFDALPLADQCRFWAGVIRRGTLPLVSLTNSGGKSIHGVIRVDAPDAEGWKRAKEQIAERYATDPDPAFRLDVQALHPLTGTRLAGSVRTDTGAVQELLFDCGQFYTRAKV